MGINVVTEFIAKGTVRVIAYVKDDTDALVDPTSVTVKITDPDGTIGVEDAAMTKTGTGVYEYYYYTTVDSVKGDYSILIWSIDGTGVTAKYSSGTFGFRLN